LGRTCLHRDGYGDPGAARSNVVNNSRIWSCSIGAAVLTPDDTHDTSEESSTEDTNTLDRLNQFLTGRGRPLDIDCRRLGKYANSNPRPRPILVTFKHPTDRKNMQRQAFKLKDAPVEFTNVGISIDCTLKQRENDRKIRAELREMREAGDKDHTIRRGKIVKFVKAKPQHEPTSPGSSTPRNPTPPKLPTTENPSTPPLGHSPPRSATPPKPVPGANQVHSPI
jgi:hypothetical protein